MKRSLFFGSMFVFLLVQTVWTQIPETILYQGVLRDNAGNLVANGNYDLEFTLFDAEAGGNQLWSESHTTANGNPVYVTGGVFSVILGSSNPLDVDFNQSFWLAITVDGSVLTPRTRLTAAPYSLGSKQATTALSVAGTSNVFPSSGSVGIGTVGPSSELEVVGKVTATSYVGDGSGLSGINADQAQNADSLGYVVASAYATDSELADHASNTDAHHTPYSDAEAVTAMGTKADTNPLHHDKTTGLPFTAITGTATDAQVPDDITINLAKGAGNADSLDGLDASAFWSTLGNSGTTAGTHYLGTSDDQALELHVNGARALRLEPGDSPNVIGGHVENVVDPGVEGATIGGGGAVTYGNEVAGNYGTIGGGKFNSAAELATVGGGYQNTASGPGATVGGGEINSASGNYAMVPGGHGNAAEGSYSFAAGRGAKAKNDGAFVWADTTAADFWSSVENEFSIRATGGFRFFTSTDGSGLRLVPNATSPNVIGGYSGNSVTSGVYGATIGGGGDATYINQIQNVYGTVGGGAGNNASGSFAATVAGGFGNKASAESASVGGGYLNTASGIRSTVSGGRYNKARGTYAVVCGGGGGVVDSNSASGDWSAIVGGQNNIASATQAIVVGGRYNTASGASSTIGGGYTNTASGDAATVPGGSFNAATGTSCFAAGRRAKAIHSGAFVWADNTDADFASTGNNQFLIRASGGVGIGTTDMSSNPKLHVNGTMQLSGNLSTLHCPRTILGNDQVYQIGSGGMSGTILICASYHPGGDRNVRSAIVTYCAESPSYAQILVQGGNAPNSFEATNANLDGQTGNVGVFTVGVTYSEGIEIENRIGQDVTFSWLILY